MIADFARYLFNLLGDAFGKLFDLLAWLFSALFEGLKEFFLFIFKPIFILCGTIFYFLYKLALLVMLLIETLYALVKFFISVMKGFFTTLISLTYSGTTAQLPARYQEVFDHARPAFSILQLDSLATLCLWAVWIFFAYAIIKIVSSRG